LPREVLKLLKLIARENVCAMEIVEVSPPYDSADITALLAMGSMLDVLAALVDEGHLPRREKQTSDKGIDAWHGT
jgi:agmatinase